MTRGTHILAAFAAIAVLAVTSVAALADDISSIEEYLFRVINDLPDWIVYPGWPVMQLGSIAAVPIVAAICLTFFRNWRVPTRLAVAGGAAWVTAKVIKILIDRGRPEAFLSDINLRPAWDGLGFPSGHTAVAFAIAVVLGSTLSRRSRIAVWGVAIVAGLLRIYTAAHFPLDVLGGWGLGAVIGSIVELAWNRQPRRTVSQPERTIDSG